MRTNGWLGMSPQRPSSLPPLPRNSSHKAGARPLACLRTPARHVWLARSELVAASGKLGLSMLPGTSQQQQQQQQEDKLVRLAFIPAWWATCTATRLEQPQDDDHSAGGPTPCDATVPTLTSLGAGSLSGGQSGWGSLAVVLRGSWADEEPDEESGMVQAGEVSHLLSCQPLLEGCVSQEWDAQEGEGEGPAGGEAQAAQLAPASPPLSRPPAVESAPSSSSSSSSSDSGSWAFPGPPTTTLCSSAAAATMCAPGGAAARGVLAAPPGMSCAVSSMPEPLPCMHPASAAVAVPWARPSPLSGKCCATTCTPPPPGMGFDSAAPSPVAPPSAAGAKGVGWGLFARSTGLLSASPRSAEGRAACRGGGSSCRSSGAGRSTTPSLAGHAALSRHQGGEPASRQSHPWSVELPCGAQELHWGCAVIYYC